MASLALFGPALGQSGQTPVARGQHAAPACSRLVLPPLANAGTSRCGKLSTVLAIFHVSDAEDPDGAVRRAHVVSQSLYSRAWIRTADTDGAATTLVPVNRGAEPQTHAPRNRDFESAERTRQTSERVFEFGRGLLEIGGAGVFQNVGPVFGTPGGYPHPSTRKHADRG